MAHAKQSKRKRRRTALPVLGAAGVSLAMAGGASAATVPTANVPSQGTGPGPLIMLGEEEISDVSLATFYVYEREGPYLGEKLRLARACGGCRGCGGCAARGCAARGCGGCAVRGCAVARCAVARCARCAVARCRCGGVGVVGCVGCVVCGGGCGPCWQWNGWTWVPVC